MLDALQQQINDFYHKIKEIKYSDTTSILRITAEIERLSAQYRDNTELLILQTHLQIMNSQEQKARTIANRVWELGGNISLMFEKMYLDDLINLGMTDMATVLIRPKFENINEGMKVFPLEMIRFALMVGNASLLKRIAATNMSNALLKSLNQFADTYIRTGYSAHFVNIQKIVAENFGNLICGYDFNSYTDRGFTDIEIVLYFSNYDFNLKKYKMLIDSKIDGYMLTSGTKRINNLSFVCRNIKDRK
ncbi:MAG: hypothetical protein IJZ59_01045 [Alphaproteobacteria bacterium]|nr:hypothetical protein [Alphaproteobacteria bacterium]